MVIRRWRAPRDHRQPGSWPAAARCAAVRAVTFGTAEDGRPFFTSGGGDFSGSAYAQGWKRARTLALTPDQLGPPLAARPYDLRHAVVSLRLNAGVHAPEAGERFGHGVDVMLRVYAKCIVGQRDVADQRIEDALAACDHLPWEAPESLRGLSVLVC
ncbi:hypothetical protein GCM10023085_06660 [Actinomadura viridis]